MVLWRRCTHWRYPGSNHSRLNAGWSLCRNRWSPTSSGSPPAQMEIGKKAIDVECKHDIVDSHASNSIQSNALGSIESESCTNTPIHSNYWRSIVGVHLEYEKRLIRIRGTFFSCDEPSKSDSNHCCACHWIVLNASARAIFYSQIYERWATRLLHLINLRSQCHPWKWFANRLLHPFPANEYRRRQRIQQVPLDIERSWANGIRDGNRAGSPRVSVCPFQIFRWN